MAITVTEAYASQCTVVRTFSGEGVGADNTVTINGMNTNTSPAITKDACFTVTLSGGAATIDLTSITDPNLGTVTFNTLTPITIKFANPSANANNITIAKGASNGYTGLGSSFSLTIPPGGEATLHLVGASAVGGSSKTFDLTGTGSQTLNVQITG